MRSALVILMLSISAACASESPTQQFCERADDCNLLTTSVDECVGDLESELAQLPTSQQGEVDLEIQQCLDHPSCSGFATCIDDLGD